MREFDYLATLFTQRIRGNEMAQDVTEAAFRLMKPDTHPNADEFRKLSVDCIYEGDRMLYIQPDECVDCGACEPVCPVEAIYYEDDVPGVWKEFGKVNTEFFIEIGSPGGASKVGPTGTDHASIAARPPKSE